MNRTVDRTIIDRWVSKHGPDGLLKLAQKSGVSASTIAKTRLGYLPRKQCTRDRLCKVLGNEDSVFPLVGASREVAS